MSLSRKVKIALDETHILILASQIVLGFQFQGVFRPVFDRLPRHDHILTVAALLLITLTIGFLVAPSMQHQLIDRDRATRHIHQVITRFAGLALVPFAIALGIDIFMAAERVFGFSIGLVGGTTFSGLALLVWYGPEVLKQHTTTRREHAMFQRQPDAESTPIEARIEHMLTEARVILPGAQALLGFQLVICFTESFDGLPASSKLVHMGSLALVALAVICLVAPAAFHRIVYEGEDTEELHAIGSRFLLAASAALALGIANEIYVVITKITQSSTVGLTMALACLGLLVGLWHLLPLVLRLKKERISYPSSAPR
jgi:hypothetical protein